jgi:D-3-phosphoglycerate dehydrogenase / 2-oxoglutarate reductase
VGTLLGAAGVNIAEYHQARGQAGEDALATISADGWLSDEVIAQLQQLPDVIDVRQIDLD